MGDVGDGCSFSGSLEKAVRHLSNCAPMVFCSFTSCVASLYGSPVLLGRFERRLGRLIPCGARAGGFCAVTGNVVPVGAFSNVAASSPDSGPVAILGRGAL